jgi:ribosomal protein RSM22 (predicted rRNA methylase)
MPPSTAAPALALPLDDAWRASIEAVARAHRWPSAAEPVQLGALVRALSDAYNAPNAGPGRAVASSAPARAARLGFSFARDVPKAAAAVRELVLSGELAARGERALRVLDVGAGLGATTWGVVRALAAAGRACAIAATWTDEDAHALDIATELARERGGREGSVTLAIHTERRRVTPDVAGPGPWDLVLLGQVLSELDPAEPDEERTRRHAHLVSGLVAKLAPGGALVIVEPALCGRTRHLHAVRDTVLAARSATVFAPCLHDAPCPAYQVPGEWCHEDLAIDLPPWLAPVARAAGLRWQGLTFSYLVLRRAGDRSLKDLLPRGPGLRARVISDALVSKGKREHFVCSERGVAGDLPDRARVSRLDRDESPSNAAWGEVRRGDVVALEPPPDAKKKRISLDGSVAILSPVSTPELDPLGPRG